MTTERTMTTEKKKETARLNGAKSRGPVTAEGKARSSQNALTHGLTAATVVLPGESEDRFHALLASMVEAYVPGTDYEASLIEKMAALTWQQDRLLAIDTETLNIQIQMMAPAVDAETANLSPVTRVTLAYRELSDNSRVLPNLDRHASRIRRQFSQLRAELLSLQKARTAPEPVPGVSTTGCPTQPLNPLTSDSGSCRLAPDFSQKLQNEPTGEQPTPSESFTSLGATPETEPQPIGRRPQTPTDSGSCLLAPDFSKKLQNEPTNQQAAADQQLTTPNEPS